MRKYAKSGGGIVSVTAGLGGACAALTADGDLIMFGAPVGHLGRGNLPDHDPTVPVPRTLLLPGAGGAGHSTEVMPGRDGVAVRFVALGGAHAVCAVEGL